MADKKIQTIRAKSVDNIARRGLSEKNLVALLALRLLRKRNADIATYNKMKDLHASTSSFIEVTAPNGKTFNMPYTGKVRIVNVGNISKSRAEVGFAFVLSPEKKDVEALTALFKENCPTNDEGVRVYSDSVLASMASTEIENGSSMALTEHLVNLRAQFPDCLELKYAIGFSESVDLSYNIQNLSYDKFGNLVDDVGNAVKYIIAHGEVPTDERLALMGGQ